MGFIDDVLLGGNDRTSDFLTNLAASRKTSLAVVNDKGFAITKPNNDPSALLAASVFNDILGYVPKQVGNKIDTSVGVGGFYAFSSKDRQNINNALINANITSGSSAGAALSALLKDPQTKGTKAVDILTQTIAANNTFNIPIGGPGSLGVNGLSNTSPLNQALAGVLGAI